MKTILICHVDSTLTRIGFARWLSSFTDLAGIIVIHEQGNRAKQRIKAEIRRVGLLRFIFDILPYRLYSKIFDSKTDCAWEKSKIDELCHAYPDLPASTQILRTDSPNSDEAREFITSLAPDMAVARCKTLIKKEIFSIPPDGIIILHPGICPEYRNAHGCFWALSNNESDKVGMSLLRIDKGIDTGPIYGYYSYPFDVRSETPGIIYNRVVYDNLDVIEKKMCEIHNGEAVAIDTTGRKSGVWGQPWLSQYLRIKRQARKQ